MSKIVGHISQVIGPVVDVRFKFDGVDAEHALPKIHDAMTIKRHDGRILVVEVQQHIGEDTVRTVAMDSTDGLQRGMEVMLTGQAITMPVVPINRSRNSAMYRIFFIVYLFTIFQFHFKPKEKASFKYQKCKEEKYISQHKSNNFMSDKESICYQYQGT